MLTSRVVRKSSLVQLGLPSRTEVGQGDIDYEEPDSQETHRDKENQASQPFALDQLEHRLNGAANHAHSVLPYHCADQKLDRRDLPAISLSEKPRSMNSAIHPLSSHPPPLQPLCSGHASSTTSGFVSREQVGCAPADPSRGKSSCSAAMGRRPTSGKQTDEQCQQPAAAAAAPPNPPLSATDEALVKFIMGGVERYFRKVAQIGRGGSSKVRLSTCLCVGVGVDQFQLDALPQL